MHKERGHCSLTYWTGERFERYVFSRDETPLPTTKHWSQSWVARVSTSSQYRVSVLARFHFSVPPMLTQLSLSHHPFHQRQDFSTSYEITFDGSFIRKWALLFTRSWSTSTHVSHSYQLCSFPNYVLLKTVLPSEIFQYALW